MLPGQHEQLRPLARKFRVGQGEIQSVHRGVGPGKVPRDVVPGGVAVKKEKNVFHDSGLRAERTYHGKEICFRERLCDVAVGSGGACDGLQFLLGFG
jgi:hypothetical protein